MDKKLNWAILGTGWIAKEMGEAFQAMGKSVYSVGSRTYSNAAAFAEKYNVQKVYEQFEDMFTDMDVDIIYIATPHNRHFEAMKKALENGKHILVEKAITLNSHQLNEMIELAQKKNLVIAEAMTIWHMPLYKELWKIVESGRLGKVQMITANFGSFKEYDMSNRFFNLEFAGGALLDIGVYALSSARSFLKEKPNQILSQMKKSAAGSDEQAVILLSTPSGQMVTLAISLHSKQPKQTVISCEKAYIEIMEYPRGEKAVIVDAQTGSREEIRVGETEKALQYEVEDMEEAVLTGKTKIMQLGYTQDVMEIMTRLRKEWELTYPGEVW